MLLRISQFASLKSAEDNKNLASDFCQDHSKFRQSESRKKSFWNSMADFIFCSWIMPGFNETRNWHPWNSLLTCCLQTSTLPIRSKLLTQEQLCSNFRTFGALYTTSAGARRTWIDGLALSVFWQDPSSLQNIFTSKTFYCALWDAIFITNAAKLEA
jgi:hypothetical protein